LLPAHRRAFSDASRAAPSFSTGLCAQYTPAFAEIQWMEKASAQRLPGPEG
jgi:hypothetical protein